MHADEELGRLALSTDDVLERDRNVLSQTTVRRIPTLVLTSGGYSRISYQLIVQMINHAIERHLL